MALTEREKLMLAEWRTAVRDVAEGHDPLSIARYQKEYMYSLRRTSVTSRRDWPTRIALHILSRVDQAPLCTMQHLADRVGVSLNTAETVYYRLRRTGYVTHSGKGRNSVRRLTALGKETLTQRRHEIEAAHSTNKHSRP